jgi:hypothetical protein
MTRFPRRLASCNEKRTTSHCSAAELIRQLETVDLVRVADS